MMKYGEVISRMTPEEKAAFLSGKNEWQTRDVKRLGIPSFLLADGPNGIRRQVGKGDHLGISPSLPATCFPAASSVACSWNEELGEELGEALGEEAEALGVQVLLGPGLNIKRSPLCGRNFEYFSEDPYLSGKIAAAYIRGIQSRGVYACPKHFAANSQELRRMSVNSVLDERTLLEIYLTGFEIAVREGDAKCIMTSYNRVNGTYANESRHLLTEILREEWGFDGFVVTDWGGSNSHVKGVAAGSDLEMPAPGFGSAREIIELTVAGELASSEIEYFWNIFSGTLTFQLGNISDYALTCVPDTVEIQLTGADGTSHTFTMEEISEENTKLTTSEIGEGSYRITAVAHSSSDYVTNSDTEEVTVAAEVSFGGDNLVSDAYSYTNTGLGHGYSWPVGTGSFDPTGSSSLGTYSGTDFVTTPADSTEGTTADSLHSFTFEAAIGFGENGWMELYSDGTCAAHNYTSGPVNASSVEGTWYLNEDGVTITINWNMESVEVSL